jgi:NADPH-dependent curcumin reductase CurA
VPFNTYAQIDGSRAANRRRTCPKGIDVYFENVGGAIWQAVLPLLNNFARVPVCGLIAQYNGPSGGEGTDQLPATMREVLSKSMTLRGFMNYEFAEQHYAEFLREVGAGIVDGRIRYREDNRRRFGESARSLHRDARWS